MQSFSILFVLTPPLDPNTGGVQMSTWKMAKYFVGRGHTVSVFSFAGTGHRELAGVGLQAAPEEGSVSSRANLSALERHVRAFAPQVVINQMPYEYAIGAVLKARKQYLLLGCLRNTLFSVLGDLYGYIDRTFPAPVRPLLKNQLGRSLVKVNHRRRHRRDLLRILETYDHFVMFGPPNLAELRYFVPEFDEDRVRLIPNSVPRVADRIPTKEKRLLWLGRIERAQKRAELIPEVWRRVCERLPDWELDIVGDGPAAAELRGLVADMRLPRIQFHGRQVPDSFYARAPIYFMTSAFEGFPNTLVEAQGFAAIPVVFDSYPVARWIVESGRNGYLIEPFDVAAMAERIVDLALSPVRDELAQGALEAAKCFHIDRVGAMWEALFEAEVPKQCRAA